MILEMDFFDRLIQGARVQKHGRTGRYDVILIQGAPGVGKSTLAANLKEHFPHGASVEVDTIRGMIHRVEWIHEEQGLHGIESSWTAGRSFLLNGYSPLILVNAFGNQSYRRIISLISTSRPVLSYQTIALYCSDEELKSRISDRKNGFSDLEPALKMNRNIRTYRHRNEYPLDTTGRSPQMILDEVLRIVQ